MISLSLFQGNTKIVCYKELLASSIFPFLKFRGLTVTLVEITGRSITSVEVDPVVTLAYSVSGRRKWGQRGVGRDRKLKHWKGKEPET